MNLLQLAQAVKRESGLTGGGPAGIVTATGDDLRMFHWAAWGWRDIDLMHEAWSWRRASATAITSGSMTLSPSAIVPGFALTAFASWLPSSRMYKPTTYRISDGATTERPLVFLDYDSFRMRFIVGVHQPGGLQYWSIAPNGDFLVGPTPDGPHFVRAEYIKDHVPLAADADIPTMPVRYHALITWYGLREYGGFDAASEVWQRADRNFRSGWSGLAQACLPVMKWGGKPLA